MQLHDFDNNRQFHDFDIIMIADVVLDIAFIIFNTDWEFTAYPISQIKQNTLLEWKYVTQIEALNKKRSLDKFQDAKKGYNS